MVLTYRVRRAIQTLANRLPRPIRAIAQEQDPAIMRIERLQSALQCCRVFCLLRVPTGCLPSDDFIRFRQGAWKAPPHQPVVCEHIQENAAQPRAKLLFGCSVESVEAPQGTQVCLLDEIKLTLTVRNLATHMRFDDGMEIGYGVLQKAPQGITAAAKGIFQLFTADGKTWLHDRLSKTGGSSEKYVKRNYESQGF